MKTAFLCNVSNHRKKKFSLLAESIDNLFRSQKEIFIVDRSQPDSTETHLTKILQNKFDRIVIVGGDGTLNRVVNYLQTTNGLDHPHLGIIPWGTCNDFARNLGYRPGEINRPIHAILKNNFKKIAFAKVNGHYFINNAGFGKNNPPEKRRGTISVLREMKPVQLKASWDKESLEGKFFMMLCANAPYFSGGLHFSKSSDPADNILNFYFVKEFSKMNLLFRLMLGRLGFPLLFSEPCKKIPSIRSQKLTLKSEQPLWIVTDGEPVSKLSGIKEATFEIAGSCNFILPS